MFDRKSVRLKGFDYSTPGAYYITLCVYNKEPHFGKIEEGEVILNKVGEMVRGEWIKSERIRKEIKIDSFVIMPNHMHAIVWIVNNRCNRANHRSPLHKRRVHMFPNSISSLIAGFKSVTTKTFRKMQNCHFGLWQRNYYEHIIRNDIDLMRIRKYIQDNPTKWEMDY